MCGGRGRSLSIVFGTWTTLISCPLRSATKLEESAVSSPPMVTRCVTPKRRSDSTTARVDFSDLVGLSRAVPSTEPPCRCIRETSSMRSGRTLEVSSRMSHLKPSCTPTTRKPSLIASMAAAEMTALMPGAGPPPTSMARTFSLGMTEMIGPYSCLMKAEFYRSTPLYQITEEERVALACALKILLRERRARRLGLPEEADY